MTVADATRAYIFIEQTTCVISLCDTEIVRLSESWWACVKGEGGGLKMRLFCCIVTLGQASSKAPPSLGVSASLIAVVSSLDKISLGRLRPVPVVVGVNYIYQSLAA